MENSFIQAGLNADRIIRLEVQNLIQGGMDQFTSYYSAESPDLTIRGPGGIVIPRGITGSSQALSGPTEPIGPAVVTQTAKFEKQCGKRGYCKAQGDPHYHTFDGGHFDRGSNREVFSGRAQAVQHSGSLGAHRGPWRLYSLSRLFGFQRRVRVGHCRRGRAWTGRCCLFYEHYHRRRSRSRIRHLLQLFLFMG